MTPTPWLVARARASPRRTALSRDGLRLDFAALARRADALSAWLSARGVGPGDRVAALLSDGVALATLLHAVDARGATLLPLHLRLAAGELAFQVEDAAPRLLLHGPGPLAERARALAAWLGDGDVLALPEGPASAAGRPAAPPADDALALLYTSGTTGRPRGALLSRGAFRASALGAARHPGLRLGARPGDRWLACLPLYHVGGLSILTRSVLQGTPVVVHDRFDPERTSRALDAEGITLVSLVPTMLERLLDARGDRPPPPALRAVLLGGAAAPAPLLARARAAGFPVAPTYGLTEAASQVATRAPGEPDGAGLRPLPGTRVAIADDAGRSAPPGATGEIRVHGPTLMRGYHRRPDATAATLRDGWLRTADVGRLDAEGRLHVLDRRSDLVVSGGENVYPAEVERALLEHPAVAEAGVAGVRDAAYGQRPAAWIVPRGPAPADLADALRRHCRERLAGYKVPTAFHVVAALPRNALGKLQRARLGDAPRADR